MLFMAQIESEAIDEIRYDADRAVLFVRFAHDGWYGYSRVPKEIYDAFIAAESHGRFFHQHVRDRYEYRRDWRP